MARFQTVKGRFISEARLRSIEARIDATNDRGGMTGCWSDGLRFIILSRVDVSKKFTIRDQRGYPVLHIPGNVAGLTEAAVRKALPGRKFPKGAFNLRPYEKRRMTLA